MPLPMPRPDPVMSATFPASVGYIVLTAGVDPTAGAISAGKLTAGGSTGSEPLEGSITSIAPGDMIIFLVKRGRETCGGIRKMVNGSLICGFG